MRFDLICRSGDRGGVMDNSAGGLGWRIRRSIPVATALERRKAPGVLSVGALFRSFGQLGGSVIPSMTESQVTLPWRSI